MVEMSENNDLTRFIDLAVQLGAEDAKLMKAEQVVVKNWTHWKCRYGCPSYGKRLMCPPYTPSPEETRALLDEYEQALLFRYKPPTTQTIAVELEKRIFLEGFYSAISFTSGGCRLCKECNIKDGLCIKPKEARPSMESCGISVFDTASNVGYNLKVLNSRDQEFFRYGLDLIH